MKNELLLFSYGSNHPDQLQRRIGKVNTMRAACLSNYIRIFAGYSDKWKGGVCSVHPLNGHKVLGYVALVTWEQILKMDPHEGYPIRYMRKELNVWVDNIDCYIIKRAYLYIRNEFEYSHPPSTKYLESVSETISSFWPEDTLQKVNGYWEPITKSSAINI